MTLRRKLVDRWGHTVFGAALLTTALLILAVLATHGSGVVQRVFILFAINLVLAAGIQTFMNLTGIVSFGHLGFMAIAAYTAGILTTPPLIKATSIPEAPHFLIDVSMGFVPATLVAALVTVAIGFVLGLGITRLSGATATVATYALFVIIQVVLVNTPSVTRGNQTFFGLPEETTIWSAFFFAAAVLVVVRFFEDSKIGLLLRATRDDEIAAKTSGINVPRIRLAAWLLSVAIVAIGGSLYAHFVTAFAPANFSLQFTFNVLIMVIVGGQTVSGVFVGAIAVTVAIEQLRQLRGEFTLGPISAEAGTLTPIILGAALILVMARRPRGLLGRNHPEDLLWRLARVIRRKRRPAEEESFHEAAMPLPAGAPSENLVTTFGDKGASPQHTSSPGKG